MYPAGFLPTEHENRLVVFHAGSLSLPMKALADSFFGHVPKTQFRMEAPQCDCAAKITELGRSCDIWPRQSYLVIDELLIPEYDRTTAFAVNSMVIDYTGNHAVQSR